MNGDFSKVAMNCRNKVLNVFYVRFCLMSRMTHSRCLNKVWCLMQDFSVFFIAYLWYCCLWRHKKFQRCSHMSQKKKKKIWLPHLNPLESDFGTLHPDISGLKMIFFLSSLENYFKSPFCENVPKNKHQLLMKEKFAFGSGWSSGLDLVSVQWVSGMRGRSVPALDTTFLFYFRLIPRFYLPLSR